jgi:hypothetical protein
MTIELRPCFATLLRPMVGALVAVPLVVLVVYPLYYLSLPDARQMIADLPQDLTLVLIGEAIAVPIFLWGWHRRARSRYWLVSDEGIEFMEHGHRVHQLAWAEVEKLSAAGDTVTLLARSPRKVHRLRFVRRLSAAAAVAAFAEKRCP